MYQSLILANANEAIQICDKNVIPYYILGMYYAEIREIEGSEMVLA